MVILDNVAKLEKVYQATVHLVFGCQEYRKCKRRYF